MITAAQARQNTNNYEVELYNKTKAKVDEFIEMMSKSIEYYSRTGIDTIDFTPYEKSRFPSFQMLPVAQEIFREILESNGYKILRNDSANNILKVKW